MKSWTCAIAMLACVTGSVISQAAELTVLAGQGSMPGVRELAAGFTRTSGHKVTVVQLTKAVEHRLGDGRADLVAANPPPIAGLVKKGMVAADTVTPYMLAGLGVSVRAGAPKPDISTAEAYRATLLAAKSIGYSSGCSGQHVEQGIAKLGLTEQLKPKIQVTAGGSGPVTLFLARGDFELGIQQTNIMVGAPGTDFVGPLPAAMDIPCPNSVGLLTASKEQEAARAMIAFMISPEAAPLLRKAHEEPAKR